MPSSASGVISSVTSGMATRLASTPTRLNCWKNTSDSGARPSVATAWARRWAASSPLAPRPGAGAPAIGSLAISSATAVNDNQKPGCSSAQGSTAVTTTAAASSTSAQGQRQPALRKATATASISTVRWAGTPQPASSA